MELKIEGWELDKEIKENAVLKQGDLIKIHDGDDPLRKAAIVVTADCDLINKKHARLITLVPAVSVKDILENYLLVETATARRPTSRVSHFRHFRSKKIMNAL